MKVEYRGFEIVVSEVETETIGKHFFYTIQELSTGEFVCEGISTKSLQALDCIQVGRATIDEELLRPEPWYYPSDEDHDMKEEYDFSNAHRDLTVQEFDEEEERELDWIFEKDGW